MSSSRARTPGDHPRSRGVYFFATRMVSPRLGSSPLARGLLFGEPRSRVSRRIIPARAGFTVMDRQGEVWAEDHPRSRGVYALLRDQKAIGAGSSPLARGLPHPVGGVRPGPGIIPARAGFTHRRPGPVRSDRDHPRSRGVYVRTLTKVEQRGGSSPLARGLLLSLPAYDVIQTDHPRSRGVYGSPRRPRRLTHGSSPLARGLRGRRRPVGAGPGIIPARAGFT